MKCVADSLKKEIIGEEDFGSIKCLKEINDLSGAMYERVLTHLEIMWILYSMFFKRDCFKMEREYRFVFGPTGNKNDNYNFRTKNGAIIPYVKKKFKALNFIKSVTVGPANNMDISCKEIKEFLSYNGCNVEVKRSKIPLRY